MRFNAEELREAITDGADSSIQNFIKKVIKSLQLNEKDNKQPIFLIRTCSQIGSILKDYSESPIMKYKIIKLLMYLVLMGQSSIYDQLYEEIYTIVRNNCFFNRGYPYDTRGTEFFKSNKYTQIATFQQKNKIKVIGCRYIQFCLELVYVLAKWISTDNQNQIKNSPFRASYETLLKEGVVFPNQDEFIFFNEKRIVAIEERIKKIREEATSELENEDDDYFESFKSKNDAQMMNGVEYLQKRLKEKEKQLKDIKSNISVIEIEKQSAIQKLKQKQNTHIIKINQYEAKITHLIQQVRDLKNKMKLIGRQQYQNKNLQIIQKLKAKINSLMDQNQNLKQQNAILQQKLSKISELKSNNISINKESSPRHANTNIFNIQLIKGLLMDCEEKKQYEDTPKKKQKILNQNFYTHKEAEEPFEPYYRKLTKELQLRFRKALFKNKEVIFKSKQLQIGTITAWKSDIEIILIVILTNLSDEPMMNVEVQYSNSSEIDIDIKTGDLKESKIIRKGEQKRYQLFITVNNIDAKCPIMILNFQKQNCKKQRHAYLLPISKIKLCEILVYSSFRRETSILQKIFPLQKKILVSIDKLKDYYPKSYEINSKLSKEYSLKIKLLGRVFFITFGEMGEEIRVQINYKQEDKCLCQKLLNELQFILKK